MPADFQRAVVREVLPAVRDRGVLSSDLDALMLDTLQNCLWDPDADLSEPIHLDVALDAKTKAALASMQNLTGGARDLVLSAPTLNDALGYIFRDKLFRAFLRQKIPSDGVSPMITAVSALVGFDGAPPTTEAKVPSPSPGPAPTAGGAVETAEVDAVASGSANAIVEALVNADRPALTRAVMTALHRQGEVEKILSVAERFPASGASAGAGAVSVRIAHARAMLAMNAAETAYIELTGLLDPSSGVGLDPADLALVTNLAARAALRSGRPDSARQLWREATIREPTNWEPYFNLANLAGPGDPLGRIEYFGLAERLATRFPAEGHIALAEALLEEGRLGEALTRALLGLKRHLDNPELLITLSNIYATIGDPDRAGGYLDAFFDRYGLPTRIALRGDPAAAHVFDRIRTLPDASSAAEDVGRVTVIMTTFNSAATVRPAIASVLAQSYPNTRLVVVDDVSTDATVEIVRQIAASDPRVTLLTSAENRGTYVAKNSAMQAFDSDYYAFHDSDDWMHPDHVRKHLEVMAAAPHLVCTLSQWVRMDETGRCVPRRGGGYLHDNPASTFFPAAVLRDVGFFDAVRTGADSEFTWRVRRRYGAKSVQTIRAPLSIGLHHAESLTTKGVAAFDEHRFSAVRLDYWESWMAWHRGIGADPSKLFTPHPLTERKFPAPLEIDAGQAPARLESGETRRSSKADGPRVATELKYFYQSPEGAVLFFHGGVRGVISDIVSEGRLHPNLQVYFTFPWYVSEEKIVNLARFLKRLRRKHSNYDPSRFCFLFNSSGEVAFAAKHLSGLADFIHFNNSALISELYFLPFLTTEKDINAVYNARASIFKRHYLSADVRDKMFISYEWRREEVDLQMFAPTRSFRDLPYAQIANKVAQAKVGMLLSEEEGACYASLEYLLTGLPVVSTPSVGGRDEFYTPHNSIIVEPEPAAVAAGVREAVARLDAGDLVPARIQQDAMERVSAFRQALAAHLETRMTAMGLGDAGVGLLDKRVAVTSKLWKFRNMWMKHLPETV